MWDRLKKILGLHDKKQAERTQRVAEYAHGKKDEFVHDMKELQKQAQKIHMISLKTAEDNGKLVEVVDDIVAKVAMGTGRFEKYDAR